MFLRPFRRFTCTFPKFTGTVYQKCARAHLGFMDNFFVFTSQALFRVRGQKCPRSFKDTFPGSRAFLQNCSRVLFRGSREKNSDFWGLSQNSNISRCKVTIVTDSKNRHLLDLRSKNIVYLHYHTTIPAKS